MNLLVNVPQGNVRRIEVYFNNKCMMDQKMDAGAASIEGFDYRMGMKILVDGNVLYNKTVKAGPLRLETSCGCMFELSKEAIDAPAPKVEPKPAPAPAPAPEPELELEEEDEDNEPVMGTTPKPFGFWNKKED